MRRVKAAVVDPWRFNVVSEKFQNLVAGQRRSGLLSEVLPKRSAPVSFGCLDGLVLFGNKEALRVNDCSAQKCGSYSKVVGSDPQIRSIVPFQVMPVRVVPVKSDVVNALPCSGLRQQ